MGAGGEKGGRGGGDWSPHMYIPGARYVGRAEVYVIRYGIEGY
jgi:hypothetical protein